MVGQLSIAQLKQFVPTSPILAFRPADTGSPMQDWCRHLGENPLRRRELEEFAILGDVVVRIADELEPDPLDRVKIMSPEYAMKVLENEIDACEFIRSVRGIASEDAGQFEYEQIAAYYYGEIRKRGKAEVLHEMGMLAMEMQAVTASIADRSFVIAETEVDEVRYTVADQRRIEAARKNRQPLPPRCRNFDEELASVIRRVGRQRVTRMMRDEFAEFYLDEAGKSLEDLDQDFETYAALEQYDENGVVGLMMSSSQRSIIAFDLEAEIDSSYLPYDLQALGSRIARLFVGHEMGGDQVREARMLIDSAELTRYQCMPPAMPILNVDSYGDQPLSDAEFNEWLSVMLDQIYERRTVRSARRLGHSRAGGSHEYVSLYEVNPDFEEMQYVAAVCGILWNKQKADFHLRSLRKKSYQELYLSIRKTTDTAQVAELKKEAYGLFKEERSLTLKEFTALNTVAKSQEARLADKVSTLTRKWLKEIANATLNKIRFLKYSLYNDSEAKALTRQEKQRLWGSIRIREAQLQNESVLSNRRIQGELFAQNQPQTLVRVTPTNAYIH